MSKFIICLLIVGVISTQTGHVITRLRKEHRETQFSRYFYDLLELRSGDALSDVTEIVGDILNKLISQQGSEDAEFATKEADLQARVQKLENDLEGIETESQSTRQLVTDLSSEIAQLSGSIHFQAKQVQILTQQITDLDATYTQQQQASSEKYDANNKLLKAVQEVLKYIENTLVSGSLIQRNDALKHMKHSLGDKHPITLLVSMTQDFDINTVHRVVAKLEAIEDRLRDTLTSIDEYNVQLLQTHQLIKSQVEENYSLLDKDLSLNRRIATGLQNDFEIVSRRAQELATDEEDTRAILTQTEQNLDTLQTGYNQRHSQLLEEISIVQSAYDLLSQN